MRLVDLVDCIDYLSRASNLLFCVGRLKYLKHMPNRRFQNRAHFHRAWAIKLSPLLSPLLALLGQSSPEMMRPSTVVAKALLVTACLVHCTCAFSSARANAQQTSSDGKIGRDGVDLYYTVVGRDGDYVLVLSGGPGEEVRSMQGIADELGKKYRCIMLEQRGTGRSKLARYDASTINLNAYIEDIEALRKQMQIDKLILVGNSWGMMLALAYGGTYPDAVRAIVTIGSGPITGAYLEVMGTNRNTRLWPGELEVREFWSEPSRQSTDFERAQFESTRAMASAYFYDRKAALQYAMEMSPTDFNFRVVPAFLKAEGNFDLRPKLKAITAPVLLLQGRQDLAGEANICEAHLLIKNSTLTFINKCGHMPWIEQPEQTWKTVHEFLERLSK
jgi:proline iminopeptidase